MNNREVLSKVTELYAISGGSKEDKNFVSAQSHAYRLYFGVREDEIGTEGDNSTREQAVSDDVIESTFKEYVQNYTYSQKFGEEDQTRVNKAIVEGFLEGIKEIDSSLGAVLDGILEGELA